VLIGLLCILILEVAGGFVLTVTVMLNIYGQLAENASIGWMCLATALDVFLTSLLLFNLLRQRTGVKRADALVYRVVSITLESALPGCICMLCAVINYFVTFLPGRSCVLLVFMHSNSKFYCYALLTTLNGRTSLRNQMDNYRLGRISVGTSVVRRPAKSKAAQGATPSGPVPTVPVTSLFQGSGEPDLERPLSTNDLEAQHGPGHIEAIVELNPGHSNATSSSAARSEMAADIAHPALLTPDAGAVAAMTTTVAAHLSSCTCTCRNISTLPRPPGFE